MKKSVRIVIISILLIIYSYFTFIAFQGMLEAVSKVGDKILDYLANVINVFVLPSTLVVIYNLLFKEPTKRFYQKNGLYQIISGGLGLAFATYTAIIYTNWGFGITPLYPIDLMIFDLVAIGLGVYLLKIKANAKEDEKKKGVKEVFKKIWLYLFTFLALDRAGAMIMSIIGGPGEGTLALIPVYLLLLTPVASLVLYVIYINITDENKKKRIWLIGSIVTTVVALITFGYQIIMLFGDNATPFMKIISSFYGLDRLASKPITMGLAIVSTLATSITSLVKYIIKK